MSGLFRLGTVLWTLLFILGCKPESDPPPIPAVPPRIERFPSVLQGQVTNQPTQPRGSSESSGPRSTPRFERLDASSVGIDFIHQWQPRDAYEAHLLRTGFTGGGVALGDLDGDGLCDVVLTRPHGGAKIYRNLGGFRFQDITRSSGIENTNLWTTGVSLVDLDNDGWLDLVLCGYLSPTRVYVNQHNGTFHETPVVCGLEFPGANVKMIFADFDRDGDLDAYLLTNRREPRSDPQIQYQGSPGHYRVPKEQQEWVGILELPNGEQRFVKSAQEDRLFRNEWIPTGRLQFTDVTESSGIRGFDHGLDAIWWDYDRDGFPDLYVGNDFTDPDRLYHNLGNGTFQEMSAACLPRTSWSTMACGAGDFNNDGLPDLFIADMAGTTHERQVVTQASMESMDWFLDFVRPAQYLRNCLFLNSGRGAFMEVAEMAGVAKSGWSWSAKIGDLDEDGREDVFISNGFTRDYLDIDFLQSERSRGAADSVTMWERAPVLREKNIAFQNQNGFAFREVGQDWGLDESGISFGAALADLDGDGDLDLVVNHFGAPPGIYRNQSRGSHSLQVRLFGRQSNIYGIGAQLEVSTSSGKQYRQLFPGNGYMSTDAPCVHFGLGVSEQVSELVIRWPSGLVQTLHDVKADRVYSVFEPPAEGTSTLPIATAKPSETPAFVRSHDLEALKADPPTSNEDLEKQPLLPYRWCHLGPRMDFGDLNGDGLSDVVFTGGKGLWAQFAYQRKEGGYDRVELPRIASETNAESGGVLVFDFDGDGDLDVLVLAATGTLSDGGAGMFHDLLLRNDGLEKGARSHVQWTALRDVLPVRSESAWCAVAWDFDRDGDLDLFIGGRWIPGAYPVTPMSRLLRNDKGRFTDVTSLVAPTLARVGMVTDAVATDVDNDGWTDLVLAMDHGPMGYFRNENGTLVNRTENVGLSAWLGMWNGLDVADLNGDGFMDWVVSNMGQNLPFVVDAANPEELVYGDLDGTDRTNLVVVHSIQGKRSVESTRESTARVFPSIRERTPTYAAFGRARFEELFDFTRIAASEVKAMQTSSSGVFLNDHGKRIRFVPFPTEAQNAPSFSVAVVYANDDSIPDVLLGQNWSYVPHSIGKLNQGLSWILNGVGDGAFRPVWPRESGLAFTGDVRAIRPVRSLHPSGFGFVFGGHGQATEAFLPSSPGTVSTRDVEVVLEGKRPNRWAIGAQVRLQTRSGLERVEEVHAGRGVAPGDHSSVWFRLGKDDAPVAVFVRWPSGQEASQTHLSAWAPIVLKETF